MAVATGKAQQVGQKTVKESRVIISTCYGTKRIIKQRISLCFFTLTNFFGQQQDLHYIKIHWRGTITICATISYANPVYLCASFSPSQLTRCTMMNNDSISRVQQRGSGYPKPIKWLSLLLIGVLVGTVLPTSAQEHVYDLLLKGGHVIDPANEKNELLDVAIHDGAIVLVSRNINPDLAQRVVDVTGLYVVPGLIDMHAHHYYGTVPNRQYSNGMSALPPDGFTFRTGVTTAVDVGGAGWTNFRHFKEQVIDRSRTRILAFINIVGDGMSGPAEQNIDDMDAEMTAWVARNHEEIVGIKIAHYSGHTWKPYERLVRAGELAGVPVMVDFGGANPPLSLNTLFHEVLRPGDIYTHIYGGGVGGRQAIVDEHGVLRDGMLEAQERGIIFDVGHGGGSFFYDVAIPAIEQGVWPDVISTDLHVGSMNGGMKDMMNVMSNFLILGMPLYDVVASSTSIPARVIQREDLGNLSTGSVADITVFAIREGEFGYLDSRWQTISGSQRIENELTIKGGRVVWDLNGLTTPRWGE